MGDGKAKSVIKRVYVPTQVRDLPNGEKLKIPGHYKAPPSDTPSWLRWLSLGAEQEPSNQPHQGKHQ